ncbi:MAG TPA: transporter [Planctomycetota bacterium]|nr:transporter [Planctomycetota bacterium]
MRRAHRTCPTWSCQLWIVSTVCLGNPGHSQEETLDIFDGETLYQNGWLLTLSTRLERREQLLEGDSSVKDPLHRRQTDYTAAAAAHYGLRYDLQLSAIVPFVHRVLDQKDPAGQNHSSAGGPGDVVTLVKWRFYRWDAPGEALNLAAIVGLEWPSGSDDERDGGVRLSPELQPGSGSWDPMAGLAATYEPRRWRFNAFGLYKHNTENGHDHRFGDELFTEVAVGNRFWLEPYPGPFMRADALVRYRNEQRARQDGMRVRDSGGDLVTVGLSWAFRPRPSLDLQLSVEVPVYERVNGAQVGREFSVSFALGYRF